jgi:ATP-dependent Clp protease adaptor protein ClpS
MSSYLAAEGLSYVKLTYWLAHQRGDVDNDCPFSVPVAAEQTAVVVLNDDFSPMDFVVNVLKDLFGLADREAIRLMLEIHSAGRAVCWRGSSDRAVTLASSANRLSRRANQPLLAIVEAAA